MRPAEASPLQPPPAGVTDATVPHTARGEWHPACAEIRRGLFALLVLLAGTTFALAASPQPKSATGMARLALEVLINDQRTQLIGDIYRAPDGSLHATRKEMIALGLRPPGKGADEDMVGFNDLPGLSLRYAEDKQELHLSAPDTLRMPREYDLSSSVKNGKVEQSRDFGAVINYNAYGTAARGYSKGARTYTTGTLSLDSRIFSPYGILQNNAVMGTSLTRQGILRLDSAYVFSDRDTATTTTIGDAVSGGLAWTRPVRFGGGQISRSFGMRPDLVTAPLPSVSGSAAVPSTVDVYVDNMRIASQDVGAGPYRINNLPVSGETGNARVVVRDVTGKETSTSLPFFTSARLLAPGMLDFSIEAGYPRLNYAIESFDYSKKFMGQGSFRYGLTQSITLEGHAEGTQKLALAGGGFTYGAGRLGTFSLAGSGSWHAGDWGAMVYAGWQSNWRSLFLGFNTQRTFGHYTDVAAVTANLSTTSRLGGNFLDSGFFVLNRSPQVPRALDRITLGKTFDSLQASLSASFINVERGRSDVSRLATITWSQSFQKKYHTFLTVFSDFGTQRRTGVVGGLSFTLGDDILVSASGGVSGRDRSGTLDVTRPLGTREYDYGWRLFDTEGKTTHRGAQAAVRTPYAKAAAGVRQDGSTVGGFGEIDGAAVLSPSGVFASTRVNDAFAIVDVGAPGVEVLHENRPVGRSGRFGKVLVPDVPSGQPTKISIAPETLPGDSHASVTEAEILPNYRGSASVNIKTISARNTANVEIRLPNGQHLPPGTKVRHTESGKTSVIGYNGKTFVPEIEENNTLTIQMDMRTCTVSFAKSDRRSGSGQVGPLLCQMQ